jgi:NAD(P)-dependent dehydrogenase (short-subunit alcohol dehydrogenase family)
MLQRPFSNSSSTTGLGDIDELNHLAVFLASNGNKYMTGSDIIIDVSC